MLAGHPTRRRPASAACAWKAPINAALNRRLVDDTPAASAYVSIITGRAVAPGQLTEDFLHGQSVLDGRLGT